MCASLILYYWCADWCSSNCNWYIEIERHVIMKNKVARKIIAVILLIIGIILFCMPTIFWLNNPELTSMQIFRHFWYACIGAPIFIIIGFVFISDDEFIF